MIQKIANNSKVHPYFKRLPIIQKFTHNSKNELWVNMNYGWGDRQTHTHRHTHTDTHTHTHTHTHQYRTGLGARLSENINQWRR